MSLLFVDVADTTHITPEVRHSTQIRRRNLSSHRCSQGVRKHIIVNLFNIIMKIWMLRYTVHCVKKI